MLPTLPEGDAAPRRSRVGRNLAIGLVLLVVATTAVVSRYQASIASEPPTIAQASTNDTAARAPANTRIKVRVLNTTSTRGLARRATTVLRDFGYDVVDFDTDQRTKRTTTLILSHRGQAEWAQRLRRALGVGAIEARADSLRYVDFTVLIGSDWKAPTQSLRP